MHPAYSVIAFTTASGAGYGLLFLLCLFGVTGVLPAERWLGVTGFALAYLLITTGLLASTFHLGHPERAWRAISQWRSSWLSREGVAALVTYVPSGLFAIGWVFFESGDGLWAAFGALWLALVAQLFGKASPLLLWLALVALALGLVVKLAYWRGVDGEARTLTPESATGLGRFGRVRPFEAPHSETNFLMREMGFRVARKHAAQLRRIALVFAFLLPLLAVVIALASGGLFATLALLHAVVFASFGLLVERWLFFAEAEHVVTLYYGAEAA